MSDSTSESPAELSVFDTVMLILGIVIGSGIFALPALVAANTGDLSTFFFAWIIGGIVSFAGALCYAELATTYPHRGGEHHFLSRAFGRGAGVLFAWARLAVLQTGSIAIQAYIVGDYLTRVTPLGERSSELIAAATVILITLINVMGIRQGRFAQVALGSATFLGVLLVAAAGLWGAPADTVVRAAPVASSQAPAFGLAMVFVLLAFGGWNEAAYVSAEVSRRNLVRALLLGIGAITAVYLLVNLAYVRGLGLAGVAGSAAVAADLAERTLGPSFAVVISLVISVAALSTMNATAITGGRSHCALGREVPLFRALGKWDDEHRTPRNALLVQGAVALGLVGLGAVTRGGFVSMVEYTAPVFWFFLFLVGVSLFVLRRRDPRRERAFRVPGYPVTPLLFCGVCLYMIKASLVHTGIGALAGVAVLLAGLPLIWVGGVPRETATVFPPKRILP
jgi:basic amino acid/polyamine antiporter, APA family